MAEDNEDKDNKAFEASDKRRQQARDDGDVAQSRELNALFLLSGALGGLFAFEVWFKDRFFSVSKGLLGQADLISRDIFESDASATFARLQVLALAVLVPVGLMVLAVLASLVLQRAIVFSAKSITPKFDKVSPFENIKKKYGGKGLTDFSKDAAKMIFSGAIAGLFLLNFAREYYNSGALSLDGLYDFTFRQIVLLLATFILFQFILAIIDLPLQRFFHAQKLRMSREEMKKEQKESEGDPDFKQARKSRAAKISNGEMLRNVEGASLIMVNPEHYAVALKWERDSANAPICVGKGTDHLAAKIRDVARENNIPVVRDPPTTRALFRVVEIGEEITPEFYAAVAAAIQYVESLKAPS